MKPLSEARPVINEARGRRIRTVLLACAFLVLAVLLWQAFARLGNPDPLARSNSSAAAIDIGVLVFREGLECVLVLAAITADMTGNRRSSRSPITLGAGAGFVGALVTWVVAVHILNDLSQSVSALALQAATGLLAVIVLLIVMNWFFHKLYWTGWISYHNKRKRDLQERAKNDETVSSYFFWGMAVLGFTSVYREGFEVVLFLQSYRLKLPHETLLWGVCVGLLLSAIVAALTFVGHQRLPYRKMLVLTGMLLGIVLVVMVGEQAQEMQLAHWISTTTIPSLKRAIPSWMGLWLSVFPTVETLLAQAAAIVFVVGSYFAANRTMYAQASSEGSAQSEADREIEEINAEVMKQGY